MPELPEVETIRRTLEPLVVGRTIASVEARRRDLRLPLAPSFEAALTGRRIVGAARRAKYLMLPLDDERVWLVHLGMSGRFLRLAADHTETAAPHEHVVVGMDDGARLVFRDPRRFGLMLVVDAENCRLLEGLGPEPLDTERFNGAYLSAQRARTSRTVKDVLMDQRVVAGLGNIYVNEILFLARIRPTRRMHRVSRDECDTLADATRTIVSEAIEHRGTSISDFLDGVGRPGSYQWRRRVYDRKNEACPRCATAICVCVVGQRSSFYCPTCQR
jgi:formamidopyrimidine-DNA glycosylase